MTDSTPPNGGSDPADPVLAAWAAQDEAGTPSLLAMDPAALVDSVAKAHRKDRRRLLWLNVQEVVPTIVVTAVFGLSASDSERPLANLVAAALVFGVGCYLAVSSIRHDRADRLWGSSVRDQTARRLAQVDHRARLYRTIAWWYLLPLAVAIMLVRYGVGEAVTNIDLVFFGFCFVLLVGLYLVNRWYGRTRYDSEVERLTALLAEFDRAAAQKPTDGAGDSP